VFFGQYQDLRAAGAGLNDDLERPALARRLADAGAQRVLARPRAP
jgi:hypothetical protein